LSEQIRKLNILTKYRIGQWYVEFQYYDKDNKFTGKFEKGIITEKQLYEALKEKGLLEGNISREKKGGDYEHNHQKTARC